LRFKSNKYRNIKAVVDGITFDSRKEARTYQDLKLMLQAGDIRELERQKRFELVPAQYVGKKCVERSVVYVADFYVVRRDGTGEVLDTKGMKTLPVYVIKRKLLRWFHGLTIKEV